MKLFKKMASFILTISLVLGVSATVYAAPNDDVIQALKATEIPATYLIQAENYLKTVTLTSAQATAVNAQIAAAEKIINGGDISLLTDAQKQSIIADVIAAGHDIGLNITVTKNSSGKFSLSVSNSTGKQVISSTSSAVKQTGVNNTVLFAGLFMLIIAAGSVFAVKKAAARLN